ncbi:Doublecortin domain-containing protein [Balamuthia mandrillaris]
MSALKVIITKACEGLPRSLLEDSILSIATVGFKANIPFPDLVQRMTKECLDIGIENFVAKLDLGTVEVLLTDPSLIPAEYDEEIEEGPRLMPEVLDERMKAKGAENIFPYLKESSLKACAQALNIPTEQPLRDLIEQLTEELVLLGVETAFFVMNVQVLRRWAAHFRLEGGKKKEVIVEELMTKMFNLMSVEEALRSIKEKEEQQMGNNVEAEEEKEEDDEIKDQEDEEVDEEEEKEAKRQRNNEAIQQDEESEDEEAQMRPKGTRREILTPPSEEEEDEESEEEEEVEEESEEEEEEAEPEIELPEDLAGIAFGITAKQLTREYKVVQLQRFLSIHGQATTGRKAQLVTRVMRCLSEGHRSHHQDEEDEDDDDDDDELEEEKQKRSSSVRRTTRQQKPQQPPNRSTSSASKKTTTTATQKKAVRRRKNEENRNPNNSAVH